jgi:integrase
VFLAAIGEGICTDDPAHAIQRALAAAPGGRRPALVRIEDVREVLAKPERDAKSFWRSLLASRLLALTAARPGVVAAAERAEFEDLYGPAPIWRIPATKMKLTRERKRDAAFEFIIPLSTHAAEVVKAAMVMGESRTHLFPGSRNPRQPLSNNALSTLYRRAGFAGLHVPNGWRASFSTIMNERAAVEDRERDRAIIDLMLAHAPDGVEAAYNRAAYMPRRREIAQAWGDLLMKGMPPPAMLLAR